MSRKAFKGICIAFATVFVWSILPLMANDGALKPIYSVTDLKIEKTSEGRESIHAGEFDDNQDKVMVALADGTQKLVSVELRQTTYIYTLVNKNDSPSAPKSGPVICYELTSKDKDVPFSWYMWTGDILGRFKLFTTQDGETYLTAARSNIVRIFDVTRSMNQAEKAKKLQDQINGDKVIDAYTMAVDPVTLLGSSIDAFLDKNATSHYQSIYITSFEKIGDGEFRLQLHGKVPSKVYTVVTDKESPRGVRLEK